MYALKRWTNRHETVLIVTNGAILVLLFIVHLVTPFALPNAAELVNVFVVALVGFLFAAIMWKGIVPVVICALGVVLLHSAIMVPYYFPGNETFPYLLMNEQNNVQNLETADLSVSLNFLLGLGMVVLSMLVAYAPKLLFTRNRPDENESVWSKYPVWYDNVKLAGRYSEPLVPAKKLMEDRDRYLLWRYEYVLANIYGALYLVRPDGLVPEKSTEFIRDKQSGVLMGKGRYDGYFM